MIYYYLLMSCHFLFHVCHPSPHVQFRLQPPALSAADRLRGSTLSAPWGEIPVPRYLQDFVYVSIG